MLRSIVIGGKKIQIDQSSVLGTGGEAAVVRCGNSAVKLYHQITNERTEKLQEFIRGNFNLPPCVCAPMDLAYDNKGKIVGFVMPLIPSGNEVTQQLCSKSYRKAHPTITTKMVADLFVNTHETMDKLHKEKIIVGDFNDLNVLFRQNAMTFIDVDSFQFGKFPCMVGTENFLDPELYNLDLSKKPYFKEEHDWYAFFVMLIRSLILTHPYGGVHNSYNSIAQRALARVTVFDPGVKYPKPAMNPDILSSNLHALIEKMFKKGERFTFPYSALVEYRDSLVECNSCHSWHPAERSSCPQCATINTQQIQRRVSVVQRPGKRTVNCEQIFSTPGDFIWWKPVDHKFYAIALESGKYVMYKKESLKDAFTSMPLFAAKGDPKFDLFHGKYLTVSQEPSTDEILVLDISGPKPVGYVKRITSEFEGERIFTCSKDHLLRMQQGYLFRGGHSYSLGQFVEKQIGSVIKEQTWLSASPYNSLVFGFERFFENIAYFLYKFDKNDHVNRFDIKIPEFDPNESLLDIRVYFASSSLLCMMKTEIKRRTFTRVFVIADDGSITSQYRLDALSSDTHRKIEGKAFGKPSTSEGIILHPTDDGVVQQILGQNSVGQQTLFSETDTFVSESDSLLMFDSGILVIGDNIVNYLTIA